ncbi:MAG: hypothetical protein ABSE95_08465 [Thermodesulfobacteriota bacterium]|jgi:hypothetical protein
MKQFLITTAAGKRLIGKAMAIHPDLRLALNSGTVVIIAGTTNGYVAEEVLAAIGCKEPFSRRRFFRGITLPPSRPTTQEGRLPDHDHFPGDVVLFKGAWQKGKTIFDVVDDLKEGDLILKGANALDPVRKRAAILIGDPKGGTILRALQAVVGRRVRLILPVGLEKRVSEDLDNIAALMNAPGTSGPRFMPVPGEIFTEIEAVRLLSGATATLVAGGGVGGAEGSIWLAVSGTPEQMKSAEKILKSVASEPAFTI